MTDAGVDELLGLKQLRTLHLPESLVTDGVLRRLREAGLLHALTQAKGRDERLTSGPDGARPSGPDSVDSVDLLSSKVTDKGLKELKGFVNLRELGLAFTKVTDEGLKELGGFTKLERLSLDSCPGVTDAGLKELAGLSNLQSLNVSGTKVKGPGFRDLAGLKRLRTIEVGRDKVTDEILRILNEADLIHALGGASRKQGPRPAAPSEVQALDFYNASGVTDAGLKVVKVFKNLEFLFLSGTAITEVGLKEIKDFGRLSQLGLDMTAVTDAGLKELAACKGLEAVYLRGSRVTDAGVKELQAALPRCRVER